MTDSSFLQLLRLLSDGKYHSGRELGESLAVSRTAVWKQLHKLDELGLVLESNRGRGYRLPGGLELLDAESIEREAEWPGLSVTVEPVVDSTNARLMAVAAQSDNGALCLAEQQSAGRGRRGRPWVSPFGRNLYMSMLWQFDGGAGVLEGLSLAVGVCVAESLESMGFSGVSLKWPNDILVEGEKLAGVLLEMTGDPAGVCQVVIGVGVNLSMPPDAAGKIDQPWVDLQQLAQRQGLSPVSRNQLAGKIAGALARMLSSFAVEGFGRWREPWLARAAFLGEAVNLHTVSQVRQGRFAGVNGSGALLLDTDHGQEAVYGGEVSVRPAS